MTDLTTAPSAARDLLLLPLDELMARARSIRDAQHGRRITYSPKVFIPLTMLCRDKCGYCTFAKAPAHIEAPYLRPDEVLSIASAGARAGCHEALFTLGERPELRYPAAQAWLDEHGYASTVDYLVAMAAMVLDETGLLPHANAGALVRRRVDAVAGSRAVAGHDDRVAQCRSRLPSRLARQDTRTTPGHPRERGRTLHPVHDGHLGRHRRDAPRPRAGARSDRRRAPAPRSRARSHRAELLAQGRHFDAQGRAVPTGRLSRSAGARPHHLARGHPPAGAAESLRRLRTTARRRHRRLGRRLPRHRRPCEPRASLARGRSLTRRDPGPRLHAGAAAHDLSRVRPQPRALDPPRCAVRGARSIRCRRPRPRRSGRSFPGEGARYARGRRRCRSDPRRRSVDSVVLGRRCRSRGPRTGAGRRARSRA